MFNVGSVASLQAAFGRGTGPILLYGLRCIGTEQTLSSCAYHGIGILFCSHAYDVGVMCNISDGMVQNYSTVKLVYVLKPPLNITTTQIRPLYQVPKVTQSITQTALIWTLKCGQPS